MMGEVGVLGFVYGGGFVLLLLMLSLLLLLCDDAASVCVWTLLKKREKGLAKALI